MWRTSGLVLVGFVAVGCEALLLNGATERSLDGTDSGPADVGSDTDALEATTDTASDAVAVVESCRSLHLASPSLPSGAYTLDPDGGGPVAPFSAYCEMSAAGGGWTLVLKIDGAQKTFAYDAPLWTDDALLRPDSTNLDEVESKSKGFSTLSFARLRLGLRRSGTDHFLELDLAASSLRALFSGPEVLTKAGRSSWLSLIDGAEIQSNCNREGVNVVGGSIGARLGILGNEQTDCASPDSVVAIGAFGTVCGANLRPAGCYESKACGAPGDRDLIAFAYVMVR